MDLGVIGAVALVLLAVLGLTGWVVGRGLAEARRASRPPDPFDVYPWPQDYLPLIVTVGPDSWALKMAAQLAVRWWNSASGMTLFLPMVLDVGPAESSRHRMVHLSIASLEAGRVASRLAVRVDRGTGQGGIRKSISVPPGANDYALDRLVARELGHVLGLSSDDAPSSVMSPGIESLDQCVLIQAQRQDLSRWYFR